MKKIPRVQCLFAPAVGFILVFFLISDKVIPKTGPIRHDCALGMALPLLYLEVPEVRSFEPSNLSGGEREVFMMMRILVLLVATGLFAACGKKQSNSANNGVFGTEPSATYTVAEIENDFNQFEFALDGLYEVGIEPLFDPFGSLSGFLYYPGERQRQVTSLNEVVASAQNLLTKYNRQYFVTSGNVTYSAQMLPERVSELQLAASEASRVVSEILSGAYKPTSGTMRSPQKKLGERDLKDWEKRVEKTEIASLGGEDYEVSFASSAQRGGGKGGGGGGGDPTTGGRN